MKVGEDEKTVSVFINGSQYDIDKNLIINKDGHTKAYCPRDIEDSVLGNITSNGRKIDADTLKNAVRGEKKETSKNKFNNFSQRTYDYDALEKMLLEKGRSK
jgi:hypothetical protein